MNELLIEGMSPIMDFAEIHKKLRRVVLVSSILIILLAAIASGTSLFTSVESLRVLASVEIGFLLSGVALFALTARGLSSRIMDICASISASLVALIGVIGLVGNVTSYAQHMVGQRPDMSVPIAIGFITIGMIIGGLISRIPVAQRVAQVLSLIMASLAAAIVVDHMHLIILAPKSELASEGTVIMSAFAFALFGLAGSFSRPSQPPCALLLSVGANGEIARRFLQYSWAGVLLFGLIAIVQPTFETFALMLIVGFVGPMITWLASTKFERSEKENRDAHEQTELLTQKMNKDLKELMASNDQASEAMKARSDFLARMSHELRTPLSAIISSNEMLMRTEQTSEQSELCSIAVESGVHLLRLINEVLDFSKLEAHKLEIEEMDFDLISVLTTAVAAVKGKAAQKSVSVSVSAGPNVPRMVRSDSGRLRQVLINLLDNAVKFTERGQVQLLVSADGDIGERQLRFLIKDTGRGIPAAFTDRLFQPFYQGDGSVTRRYGGTGLGLSICKSIVELMGGQIGARSEIGEGSDFWFTIPLMKCSRVGQKDTMIELPIINRNGSNGHGTIILVAEDNPVNARIASLQLSRMGYEVEVVGNGKLAVEAAARKNYDLILMDVQMPELDGLQAAALIRGNEMGTNRHVPIVALTAHATPSDKEQCLFAGMDEYITKPPGLCTLAAVVKKYTSQPRSITPEPSALTFGREARALLRATGEG
jgi:signal transduction histidine kinase/CheY-like chemotaxis protein